MRLTYKNILIIKLFLSILFSIAISSNSYSQSRPKRQSRDSLSFAGKLIQKEKYDKAIAYLRHYLRKNRKNFDAWTLLGVSYFHSGLPKRAIKILKYSEKKTKDKAYNHYYQGLSYDALRNKSLAQRYFQKVALSSSTYADPAAFELAVSYFNMKNRRQAAKWTDYYISKFPSGRYISKAIKMKPRIQAGKLSPKVTGIKKPNLEKALFKYGALSLMEDPHFWYVEVGGRYSLENGFEPNKILTSKNRADQILAIDFKSGFGLGPYRSGDISVYGGYSYDQAWDTTQERLNLYLEDPTDLGYFPFRPDLLKRDHSFYGDFRTEITDSLYSGFFLKYQMSYLGSYIEGPEDWGLEETVSLNDETLFIPWFGYQWSKSHRSLFYWYFNKNIDVGSNEFSKQTYAFGLDSFPVSIGVSHSSDIDSIGATFNLELYKYEFIFNDPYKDHTRIGALGSFSHVLFPTVELDLTAGYYKDTYLEPRIQVEKCGFSDDNSANDSAASNSTPSVNCPREDNGYIFSAQLSWAYRQFYRVFAKFQLLQNQNDSLKEFDFEQQNFLGGITLAFPSVKRTVRYSERFADRALERGLRP